MKITVLGCGTLGQIWLAALSHYGYNVQGWLKIPKSVCNIYVVSPTGKESRLTLPANSYEHLSTSNLLLVTLKAWQVSRAVQALLPYLSTQCTILLLNNGLGVINELPVFVQPLIIGTTTHAGNRKENGIVQHVYAGITNIGPGNSQAKQQKNSIAKILHHALPDVIWHNNITILNWFKLAANCVINPLTAIYNCRNGELRKYSNKIESICRELAMVMSYEGHRINHNSLLFYVKKIISDSSNNISSMLQDIKAQRRSEIDYINGYVLRCANVHKLNIPTNTLLVDLIKRQEKKYL